MVVAVLPLLGTPPGDVGTEIGIVLGNGSVEVSSVLDTRGVEVSSVLDTRGVEVSRVLDTRGVEVRCEVGVAVMGPVLRLRLIIGAPFVVESISNQLSMPV